MNRESDSARITTSMDIPGEGHPDWRPVREGLRMRLLFDGEDGYRVALLHYHPGATSSRHLHVGDEHTFILSGSQRDENGSYGPGSYLFNPAGTAHSVDSPDGCLVLIHWRAPAALQRYGEPEGA
jgi:anti-sigma factor ChrR (cupin superfamily)